ncbi:MAG: metal-dependent transcriptional regulator [Oscillospiraceae bacterium]|nr:metal-dependent transcriptional regulator [Oscillospiraceae bacterium]
MIRLQESGEMYLETILVLSRKNGSVRSIDIAEQMNYSKPSVSRAMSILKSGEYITVDRNGYISLTEKGSEIAEKIYERHTVISELLIRLGVDEETAVRDACKIEHDLSDTTFEIIKKHIAENI